MSEHMTITGPIEYDHLPYEDETSFTWCSYCKKQLKQVTIQFHNGISTDWTQVICPKCKKTIWTSELERKRDKEDKKCVICKKSTSYYNAVCTQYIPKKRKNKEGKFEFKTTHICSTKCYKKNKKIEGEKE